MVIVERGTRQSQTTQCNRGRAGGRVVVVVVVDVVVTLVVVVDVVVVDAVVVVDEVEELACAGCR